jgi:hypothetical protein
MNTSGAGVLSGINHGQVHERPQTMADTYFHREMMSVNLIISIGRGIASIILRIRVWRTIEGERKEVVCAD